MLVSVSSYLIHNKMAYLHMWHTYGLLCKQTLAFHAWSHHMDDMSWVMFPFRLVELPVSARDNIHHAWAQWASDIGRHWGWISWGRMTWDRSVQQMLNLWRRSPKVTEGHRRSSGMGGMVVSLHRLQYHHYHPKKFMQKMSMEADHIILKLVRLVRLRWFQVLDTSNMKQEFLEHWPVKDHVSPELLQSPAASFASGIPRPSLSSSYAMQHQHWHGLRNPTSQLFLSLPRLAMC